jgi:lipopolysaccharide biosynthesis regulator YciM
MKKREEAERAAKLKRERDTYLKGLAKEFARARRTDDKAVDVFEELAADPDCELRWLIILAIIYMIRMEWGKLKDVAERLEQRTEDSA